MHFGQPENLYLMALVPALAAIFAGWWMWKRHLRRTIGDGHLIDAMAHTSSPRRQMARGVLAIVAVGLIAFATAQPQWGQTDRRVERTGIDVVFALDLSKSMQARDITPNRLQAAKDEITSMLDVLGGDRVGLVVFTAISFAQSPLTSDYGALRFYLRRLEPGQMPYGGTSLGRAMLESLSLLTGEEIAADGADGQESASGDEVEMKRAKTQIIVLFTDGEDHESNPSEIATKARERGIRVVTVGLGSTKGSRIPIYDEDGELTGYKRNRDGEIVYTRLDPSALRTIAEETGGIYVPYQGENSVANALIDYINRLEKSELETLLRRQYRDRFMLFLVPGVLLLLLSLLLGDRRRTGRSDRRRRWPWSASAALVMALLATLSLGCEELVRRPVDPVAEGNEALAAERYEEALERFREAEEQIPTTPELHYDIGRAHLGLEQYEEARDRFTRALGSNDPALRFDATYNLGLALAGDERWKEAYETFREALALVGQHPGLAEREAFEDARHNLQVAWRKLYPPCRSLEDDSEENDEPGAAAKLEDLEAADRSLCGGDDDWYVIPAIAGSRVSVEATFSELREEPDPEKEFLPKAEDLQIALFDSAGEKVLAVDQGLGLSEDARRAQAERRSVTRSIADFEVGPDMVRPDDQSILLKVRAAEDLEFRYDIEVTAIPPCHALEDTFEDNDTAGQAATIAPGSHDLHTCPGDDDYYALEARAGDTIFVDLTTQKDIERGVPPELDMELFDRDSGEKLADASTEGGVLTARLWGAAEPRRVGVRVVGADDDQQGPYRLDIYRYAPCPTGDDRYEENDAANAAATLEAQQPVHRYLRLCPNDPDFYRVQLGEDKKLQLGLAVIEPPEDAVLTVEDDERGDDGIRFFGPGDLPDSSDPDPDAADAAPGEPYYTFDLMSESGARIEVAGEKVERPDDDAALRDGPTRAAAKATEQGRPQLTHVLAAEDLEVEQALVRVQGSPTFYHLVQLDPQKPPQKDKKQDKKQDQKKEDQEGEPDDQKKKDQQDEQKGDSGQKEPQDSPDEGSKDDPDQKNEGDEAGDKRGDEREDVGDRGEEEEPGDKRGDRGEQKREGPSDDKEEAAGGEEPGEKEKPEPGEEGRRKAARAAEERGDRRTEDILKALEANDDNFQMRKALEDMPKRFIEKDW